MGAVPLFHFTATEPHANLWDSHPTFQQFKSLLLDFFRGNEMDGVSLKGLQRVISVTIGDSPASAADVEGAATANGKGKAVESLIGSLNGAGTAAGQDYVEDKSLPPVHFRTYSVQFMRSGLPQPRVELSPHGPHFTFSLRRSQLPGVEVQKQAYKKAEKKSAASKPKNKNIDVGRRRSLSLACSLLSLRRSPHRGQCVDFLEVLRRSTRWATRSAVSTSTRKTSASSSRASSRVSRSGATATTAAMAARRMPGRTTERQRPRERLRARRVCRQRGGRRHRRRSRSAPFFRRVHAVVLLY